MSGQESEDRAMALAPSHNILRRPNTLSHFVSFYSGGNDGDLLSWVWLLWAMISYDYWLLLSVWLCMAYGYVGLCVWRMILNW